MKYLLDVNALLAGALATHPQHPDAFAWLAGKRVVLCPISELGFIRISTNKKAINITMEDAREALSRFARERKAELISDDLPPLMSKPRKSEEVTDLYLADLAARHGLKLGTFDTGIKHPAVEVISKQPTSSPGSR